MAKRAFVVWQRIVWPDGSSLALDDAPASDPSGYAGLADRVGAHGWQLIKGVALSTLLGTGTELSFGDDEREIVRRNDSSEVKSVAASCFPRVS